MPGPAQSNIQMKNQKILFVLIMYVFSLTSTININQVPMSEGNGKDCQVEK